MQRSALWLIGCAVVTLIAIGLALKWTEPKEAGEPVAPTAQGELNVEAGPAHVIRRLHSGAGYPIFEDLSDELVEQIVTTFENGDMQTVESLEGTDGTVYTLASSADATEYHANQCGYDSQGLCFLFRQDKKGVTLLAMFDGSRTSPHMDPGEIKFVSFVEGNESIMLFSSVYEWKTKTRQAIYAIDGKTGDRETIAALSRTGDDVILSRGGVALSAAFNRASPELPASSVTFTDDSRTELTVSGTWETPSMRLDAVESYAQKKGFVFSLPTANGSALYLYDPDAKERLSLIREIP